MEKNASGTEWSCGDMLIQESGNACADRPGLPARVLVLLLAFWTFTAADESLLKQDPGELKALLEELLQGWKCSFQSSINPVLGTFMV